MGEQHELTCPLCLSGVEKPPVPLSVRDVCQYACNNCGCFEITDEAFELLKCRLASKRHLVAGAVAERSHAETVLVSTSSIRDLLAVAPRDNDLEQKARCLLRAISRQTSGFGRVACLRDFTRPDAYAKDGHELVYLWHELIHREWARPAKRSRWERNQDGSYRALPEDDPDRLVITSEGWDVLAGTPSSVSCDAFVAMWFDGETDAAWREGIRPALEGCRWRAERIDLVEHNGDIVDRILADIRGSRFLVAEFTGQRPGVYFEAGFALGLGIPVIWVCREDEIEETHFDTNHFSHVVWKTPEDLREKLANRIRATIGEGTYQPPAE